MERIAVYIHVTYGCTDRQHIESHVCSITENESFSFTILSRFFSTKQSIQCTLRWDTYLHPRDGFEINVVILAPLEQTIELFDIRHTEAVLHPCDGFEINVVIPAPLEQTIELLDIGHTEASLHSCDGFERDVVLFAKLYDSLDFF